MINAVDVVEIRKTYRPDITAVSDISLIVETGEIVGILGPNGAGKSTLLRMLMTLTTPTAGHAAVMGLDVVREGVRVRQRVGYVPQVSSFDEFETPRSSLQFQSALYRVAPARRAARIEALLELFHLTGYADRRIKYLSGGMRRRVDLAAALVHEPKLLIMDEPTTGLDPVGRRETWSSVRRLVDEQGMTILFTTHYLEEADLYANRVLVIDDGVVAAQGTPDQLKTGLGGDRVSVRLAEEIGAEALARVAEQCGAPTVTGNTLHFACRESRSDAWAILDAVNAAGLTIASTEMSRPSLDDVYLRATGRTFDERAAALPPPKSRMSFMRGGARA